MLTVRLGDELEQQLDQLARDTGRPKSFYVKEALVRYLEDRADYLTAVAALEREDEALSAADVRSELGL